MTWLFGASHQYGTQLSIDEGWDVGVSTINYTATGGPFAERYSHSNTIQRTLGVNAGTLYFGRWLRRSGVGALSLWQFIDSGTVQCTLGMDATSHFLVRNAAAGTIHGTSTYALPLDTWVFVEWEVVFGNTGSSRVWVDGSLILTVSSVDLTASANNFANQWKALAASSAVHEGVMYIVDNQGAGPVNFRLGPIRAGLLPPGADGNYTAWTPSTGTRFGAVDETPTPNDDTDYISSNTVGQKNSVALTNTPGGVGTIYGVAHYFRERRDDAGPHTVRQFLRLGTTDYPEATETSAASYVSHSYQRGLSPATSAAWTPSELDGAELGVELVS